MKSNRRLFCLYGLLVAFAYDDVSYNKFATQSHTWVGTGYDAANAVDGNPATCMRTMVIGLNTIEKTLWWKVDLGGVYNIYGVNIQYKNYEGYEIRQRGRFAGFSLFVSNTGDIRGSTLCYKDGPQLPPLNFTTTCTKYGRYVIFYNERLDGVTYPKGYEVINAMNELCEVTVLGCQNASFYGSNCNTPCPTNCKDSTCHIQSGTCFTCKPGWSGENCNTSCKEGWYGMNCSQQCTKHCRDEGFCNHVTGQCDRGCAAGWTGVICDAECDDGTYGYNCVNSCSGHCLNNSPCNKQTGHCDEGCNPGYTNSYCSRACTKGYFGTNCSRICSPYCKHYTCQHTNGWCTTCASGWMGYNCTTECISSYGENCQYQCNVHCANRTCDRINGSCLYGCTEREQCDIEAANVITFNSASSDNHHFIVGGILVACVFAVFGVSMVIFLIRRKISSTKYNTDALVFCCRCTSTTEHNANLENISNYQELNFSLHENPYQSITQ